MALFGRKKKTPAVADLSAEALVKAGAMAGKEEKKQEIPVLHSFSGAGAHILRNPRITEKASMHMETGVYAFDVSDDANKNTIAHAVYELYKVRPRAVRVVTIPRKVKRSSRTGKRGITRGGKKAYVYLKKGETITLT